MRIAIAAIGIRRRMINLCVGEQPGEDTMIIAFCHAGWIAAAVLLASAGPTDAVEVQAITTPGKGDLTMCPATFGMMRSCNLYHHIKMPPHIKVGDRVKLRFGSNPKQYRFPVARIVRDGAACTVYSQTSDTADVEKIEIASCGEPPPEE
jgi:hypothetical protein